MNFFKRFQRQRATPVSTQASTEVGGYIAYYGLVDWWLATFTPQERDEIAFMQAPLSSRARPLTQGQITHASQSAADFLVNLADTFFQAKNDSIGVRIRAKVRALGGVSHPGWFRGRHYTSYVNDVNRLKREGDANGAERLLLALVDVIETEARIKGQGVAPWYYDELAKLYRAHKDYAQEVAVLERFQRQPHARGVRPQQLAERLEKARKLLATQTTNAD